MGGAIFGDLNKTGNMGDIIRFRDRSLIERLVRTGYLDHAKRRSAAAIEQAIIPARADLERLQQGRQDARRRLQELIESGEAPFDTQIEVSS